MKNFITALLAVLLLGPQVSFAKTTKNSVKNSAKHSTEKTIALTVTEKGFEPNSINIVPGTNLTLNVTRKTNSTCATQIAIPAKKIVADLPLNKTVSVKVGMLEKGEVRFACGMNMLGGVIVVK